ncbi:MAG: tyrosine-type recombinase/integrase [Chloroflexi bacterium]|nr:tyrosine-type recombinase/integrase [Chloroflexota bacterium]
MKHLRIRGCSTSYTDKISELLRKYLSTVDHISAESAIRFLAAYIDRTPNTKARYATYLRGFLEHHGIPFPVRVKVPKQLPPLIPDSDIQTLLSALRDKQTHKECGLRDLVLIETACKTGLRRSELANLKVRDIDFGAARLKVVNGKGGKDRVIPLHPLLKEKLLQLCNDKGSDSLVFGLNPRSLGMKLYVWAKKANVKLHTHSLRHYFATRLVDRGANLRAVQELLGHENLNTTQIYLAVTGRHLEEAINLLD